MQIIKHTVYMVFVVLLTFTYTANAKDLLVKVTSQQDKPIEQAIVYLESEKYPSKNEASTYAIEQRQKTFIPLITVIPTGSFINFPNNDTVRHHVYSFSPSKTFELKLYSGVPSKPVLFEKAGTVVLGCNIHDSMLAYVHVVDTPFFAKTNALGEAKFENLPVTEFHLKIWYYNTKIENQITDVLIKPDQAGTIQIKLDAK